MYTPEDIQWFHDRFDMTRESPDPSKWPDEPEEFRAYREKYRKVQDAVTAKLRRESEAKITPARRQRMNKRLKYLRNQPA